MEDELHNWGAQGARAKHLDYTMHNPWMHELCIEKFQEEEA